MKMLLVSPFLPYPPVAGGHAQVWAWLRRLAANHQLAFIGFSEREADGSATEEISEHCPVVRTRLRRPTPHAYSSFAQFPSWVTEFFSEELASDIREVTSDFCPELVFFLSTNMAQYRRCVGDLPTAVAALEIVFLAYGRRIAAARGLHRLRARLDWLRMLRYEAAVFRAADHVIAVSEADAEMAHSLAPDTDVTAVPPGVDREKLSPRPRRPVPGTVLFVGHMEHYPNVDGLLFLYREIWPLVRQQYPTAKLTVCGAGSREELARVAPGVLSAIESDSSVHLAGYAPDLQQLMDRTAAMAAPVRLGAGVRNKVIESLAAGLPVVSTTLGAEGLAAADERELLIANDAPGFAQQLLRLLLDDDLHSRLGRAGRELVAREHDNDMLAKRLERALIQTLGARV
jgi:glycosyltransferase involved in cell wall biosynthesis